MAKERFSKGGNFGDLISRLNMGFFSAELFPIASRYKLSKTQQVEAFLGRSCVLSWIDVSAHSASM